MVSSSYVIVAALTLFSSSAFFVSAFTCRQSRVVPSSAPTFTRQPLDPREILRTNARTISLFMSDQKSQDDGVVELVDEEEETVKDLAAAKAAADESTQVSAPFLSQGEILEDALNPDLSDPKQTRVILYIIISLLPVLFLIPLMLGSRDLIPLTDMPPVNM